MSEIKPFHDQGHYTEVHNMAFDYIMPRVSGSAWKVLCLIIRKTKGWGKRSDEISYSQIKDGTGIKNDLTVKKALGELLKLGCILKRAGETQFKPTRYALNRNFAIGETPASPEPEIEAQVMPPATENVVEDATTFSVAVTTENVVATATEKKAATTTENVDTKAKKQYESNRECVSDRNPRELKPIDTPAPARSPSLTSSSLIPDPREANDTLELVRICCINIVRHDPRDAANWADAVATVRASMPDATPEARATAIAEFDRRWRDGGRRGSPYLGQIVSQWARVMNGDLNPTNPDKPDDKNEARKFHDKMERARKQRPVATR